METLVHPVVLCGGSGTRLWPLSRQSYPKQFVPLMGPESLFQATLRRVAGAGFAAPVVLTGDDFRFIVSEQLAGADCTPEAILIEPDARNTAPALLAAALWLAARDPQAVLLVLPSDHVIPDAAAFRAAVLAALPRALAGDIVTFGVVPTRPETGYGYLHLAPGADPAADTPQPLAGFVEKPDAATALRLLAGGRHLWNAGIFLFSARALVAAFRAHRPDMLPPAEAAGIAAPGLKGWSRFTFFQGIFAYVAPLIWLAFIAASVAAVFWADLPDYFPQANWPFPVFPNDQTPKAIGLAVGVFGLLVMPKLLVALEAAVTGRAEGFGGRWAAARSMLAELALSSLVAPVLLAYQSRSVLQVLSGRDGGWPPNNRGDGSLTLAEAWAAARWISGWGLAGLAATQALAPVLTLWLLPVTLPMLAAPLLVWWTSHPGRAGLFAVPEEQARPDILHRHDRILELWAQDADLPKAA